MDVIMFVWEKVGFGAMLTTAAAAFIIYLVLLKRRYKSPPEPWLVPFLGIIPGIVADLRGKYMTKWAEQFKSQIIQVRFMGTKIVVLCSYDLMKHVFTKRTDLVDRMEFNNFNIVDPKYKGFAFSSGPTWRDARRVVLRLMRDLGMSNNNAESYIIEEGKFLLRKIDEFQGAPFDPVENVKKATSNVMSRFLFCQRFDYDDEKYIRLLHGVDIFVKELLGPITAFVLPFRLGRWIFRKRMQILLETWAIITEFMEEQIQEHKQRFNGTVNDMTDAFLEDVHNGAGKLDMAQIRSNVIDMYLAGTDTSSVQLQWLILYMAKYQNVQQRVYEELITVFESNQPALQYKKQTMYTEAVINEVMRLNPVLDFGTARTNLHEDFEIEGYVFPKGTPVLPNIWGIQFNPSVFKNPHEFDPGHFLTENNQLKNQDQMVAFSLGRRNCPGEPLAKMVMYLFFVMLVLKYEIKPPDDVSINLERNDKEAFNKPDDFKVRMVPRIEK